MKTPFAALTSACVGVAPKALTVLAAVALAGAASLAVAQDEEAKPVGNADAGAKKNASCIGCHGIIGYQASFPEVHKVPKIAGQSAGYIAAALHEYKKGERKHPSMRGVAQTLTEQDIADLAAYYAQQGGPRAELPATPEIKPSAHAAELLTKGNCTACHGANLSKPIAPEYPKLAGQYGDYLYVALKAYATQNNPLVGRVHAIMGAQVKPYSHEELKALAGYISSLPGDLQTVPQSKFK